MNIITKSIPHFGGKAITKLFDRPLSRFVKLWYDKEITTTLTVSGIVRTTSRTKV